MQILIVDNEIAQVENLKVGLSCSGHHVLQALSGHEALQLLENDAIRIDMVITDYTMPGMNGIELLQNIRWKHGRLPVILMTANERRELILEAFRNQCNGFIDKPFTLNQLLHEIDRVKALVDQSAVHDGSSNPRQKQPLLPIDFNLNRNDSH